MFTRFREHLVSAFASPPPLTPEPLRGRERSLLLALACATAAWILVFKLQCYWGLETTEDLYVAIQASTSWVDGRWFEDHAFRDTLRIHTYFLAPLLGIFAVPFGAIGLFLSLALAAAGQVLALVGIQRRLQVPLRWALPLALALVVMPLSMHMYQDSIHGYHYEQLEPVLALWLAYFLLGRNWRGALPLTLALILFKEDAPLLVIVVAGVVLVEDLARPSAGADGKRWNFPAAVSLLLAAVSIPLLLAFLQSRHLPGQVSNFSRVHVGDPSVTGPGALLLHVLRHPEHWLQSGAARDWLGLVLPATFGLALLRPHLLPIGLLTTATAWLVGEDLLWAPRVVQALAFFQLVAVLGFASACRLGAAAWTKGRPGRVAVALMAGLACASGVWQQWQTVPKTSEVYRLHPQLAYSRAELKQADRLYAIYRREAGKNDPVIASPHLFRHAHDRNLYWHNNLTGWPTPTWILWDRQERTLRELWTCLKNGAGAEPSDYRLVAQSGRFLLLKRKTATELAQPVQAPAVAPD